MKRFSVIMPIYNREGTITEACNSVFRQTYSDWELLCVDDGSEDCSPSILNEYAYYDSRVIVILKRNGGVSSARNAALEVNDSEYILFLDSDDRLDIDTMRKLSDCIEKSLDDMVCFGYIESHSGYSWVPAKDHAIYGSSEIREHILPEHINVSPQSSLFLKPFVCNKCFKSRIIKKNGIKFDESRKTWEDNLFIVDYLNCCASIQTICEVLYHVCGDATDETRLSKLYDSHMLCQYINQYGYLLDRFGKVYQFDNKYTNDRYAKMINIILRAIYEKGSFVEYNKAVQIVLTRPEVKNWFSSFIPSNNQDKKLQSFILNSNTEKLVEFYKHNGETHNWIKQIVRFIRRHLSPYRKKIREYIEKIHFLHWAKKGSLKNYYLIGTPIHDNIGDCAIAYAETCFLQSIGIKKECIKEITVPEYKKYRERLVPIIRKSKHIILLHGGGNMGNQWIKEEYFRRNVLEDFRHHDILIFPQTFYYSDDEIGQQEKSNSVEFYNRNNIKIVARERLSFELMQKTYGDSKILFTPDIVLSNGFEPFKGMDRNEVLFVLRNDEEKAVSETIWDDLKKFVTDNGFEYIITDMCTDKVITKENRREIVYAKLEEFASSKFVITDRLHAMIFAFITGTPCVVLTNNNHKIKGTYEWIKNTGFIKYANNLTEAQKWIAEMCKHSIEADYVHEKFKEFEKLKDEILR